MSKDLLELTRPFTLLYAEDEPDIRNQMSGILSMLFKHVYIAVDGQEGVELYQQHDDIDLIIADINMPRMNGLEMSTAIKKVNSNARIIFITAHNDLTFFAKAIEIGVDGFIVKPVDQMQLKTVLHKTCNMLKMESENNRYKEKLEALVEEKTNEIRKLYKTDRLTGCLNREQFDIDFATATCQTIALLNIDNFSQINSVYGYNVGDQALSVFAHFVVSQLKDDYKLYRIGGDEFALMGSEDTFETIRPLIEELIHAIELKLFSVNDIEFSLTCTIGISEKSDDALTKAHAAIEEVRHIGKNRYNLYNKESTFIHNQKNNIEWMRKVKSALKENRIIPYFQPIVDNETQQPVKYECLARLLEADKIISPYFFIEPARLVGLLPNITQVMIEKSFDYFSKNGGEFTINITEDDLKAGFVPAFLDNMVAKYDVAPQNMTLEILENISAQGTEDAIKQLVLFKEKGFKLALDDFGSEKSNFHRLQKMSVDFIKIDGMFIKDIDTNPNSCNIVKTITDMAHSMGAKVVAEFVHSESVYNTVKKLGIDYSQGYYFNEPKQEI